MMQLDDLDRIEVGRGRCGEPHHEHGRDAEVRRDQRARLWLVLQPGPHRVEPLLGPARCADDNVLARVDAPLHVANDRIRRGEVDHDIRCTQRLTIITNVESSNELHVICSLDRATDFGAHATAGAQHADIDRHDATERMLSSS